MFVEGRDRPSVCGGGWLRGLPLTSEEGRLGQFGACLTVRGPAFAVLLECVSSLNAVTCHCLVVTRSVFHIFWKSDALASPTPCIWVLYLIKGEAR